MTNRDAIILLNGEFLGSKADFSAILEGSTIFCADGGANLAFDLKVIPRKIVGDMDSISDVVYKHFTKVGTTFERYPKDKDLSDFELILEEIHDKFETIYVLGGLGKRSDHTMFNLGLLENFPNLYFLNGSEEIFLVEKETTIKRRVGATLSLLPLSELLTGVELTGVKFPLVNEDLRRGATLTLSNIVLDETVIIKIKDGKAIAFINREKCHE